MLLSKSIAQHKEDNTSPMLQATGLQCKANCTSRWQVHLAHCEADKVGSLGVDPVAVDRPGGIGNAGSLRIIHICLVRVW